MLQVSNFLNIEYLEN